jgi:hypothetical protein
VRIKFGELCKPNFAMNLWNSIKFIAHFIWQSKQGFIWKWNYFYNLDRNEIKKSASVSLRALIENR